MAARSGDGNQPQEQQQQQQQEPAVNGGEDFPEEHLPPVVEVAPVTRRSRRRRQNGADYAFVIRALARAAQQAAGGQEQAGIQDLPGERTPDRPPAPASSSAGSPRRATTVARLSFRALRLWRRLTVRLLQWFAARPLGQRALEAVGHTIATAEQATLWAGAATRQGTDRPSLPFAWYFMMPVVMGLMVVRTGAALAERYLNVQLPQNRELVNWFQTQRIHLEQLQTEAAANIRIVYLDQYDSKPSFLDTWPFNIPFWAAQQLGIVPVFVKQQSSDTSSDSTSVPTVEPATSASSGSSTLTEAEEHAEPSSRELTPPPEAVLDRTLYFSPVDERQAKEEEEEKEQKEKQQEGKGEIAQEQTEQPTMPEEEAVGAATAVVSPQPSPPPEHKELEDKERAAMGEVPPPAPQPTSEDLLAAERTSTSAPASSSGVRKTVAKSSKTSFLVNLFATKLA